MANGISKEQIADMVTHVDHEMARVLELGQQIAEGLGTPERREAYAAHFRTLMEFFGVGRGGGDRRDVRASDYLNDAFSTLQNDAYAKRRLADADKLLAHLSVGRIEREKLETEWGCNQDRALIYEAINAFIDATKGRWAFNTTAALLSAGAVMDEHLTRIFCLEIERQAGFGIAAATDLAGALAVNDMNRIWYSIQGLLVAAANVSKFLWPSSEAIAGRSAHLRRILNVKDDSPVCSRAFRNHFEHFDSRLEKWAKSSVGRNIADVNVSPAGMISGLDSGDYLRNFDPSAYVVTFRGDTYLLAPIVEELQVLQNAAASVLIR